MGSSAYLVLETGEIFKGEAMGAVAGTVGELVFTTASTGYLEALTDPSYFGQIVVQAFPLIGNSGVISEAFESEKSLLCGYIVSEWCHAPSNFRSEGSLDAFLKSRNIPGICGIDTRALVKTIRENGVMNACFAYSAEDAANAAAKAKAFCIEKAVENASSSAVAAYGNDDSSRHVVLWNFGTRKSTITELVSRSCKVTVVPYSTTAAEILALKPDGIMLSEGPGDPAENKEIIAQIAELCKSGLPIFGAGLGHQLLALAKGARTIKLHYGHRGANQPVKDTATNLIYITGQNQGYAVTNLPKGASHRFMNANDYTCEGVDYSDIPAFSVQFHPEKYIAAKDDTDIFGRFIAMIDKGVK